MADLREALEKIRTWLDGAFGGPLLNGHIPGCPHHDYRVCECIRGIVDTALSAPPEHNHVSLGASFVGVTPPGVEQAGSGHTDDYVAWLRWSGDEEHRHLVVCDSDSPRAFKVYRRPND